MTHWTRRHFMIGSAAALLGKHAFAGSGYSTGNGIGSSDVIGADNPVVDAFVKAQPFYGVVMLGKRGKPTYVRAIGMANIEEQKPLRADTPFAIASISKWLTSVTVLRLVEMGKLDLDAPIKRYLPAHRADTGSKVTLRHLLSNASGIPNQFISMIKADRSLFTASMTTAQAMQQFCQGESIFPPGSKFDYALTNWIIVVGIVEAVTGQPFQQAMRNITLDPLKLSATRADQAYADDAATAVPYATINPPARKTDVRQPYMAAAGGYYSTADDLIKAAQAIFNQGFITPASLAQLTHIEVDSESYALGGRVKNLQIAGQTHRFGWETGRTTGYRSVLGHRLDGEDTVIILNNTDMSQKTMDEFAYSLLGASQLPAA
ncbi:serine hydrolase domain-containing protein [Undibacterium sp. Ji49W]|uniref:serine hydrolase domain-containing protein n=1 Tax=Undibacterium sp. Ji49W TaxID=3413040 RepID=UPI003BF2FC56